MGGDRATASRPPRGRLRFDGPVSSAGLQGDYYRIVREGERGVKFSADRRRSAADGTPDEPSCHIRRDRGAGRLRLLVRLEILNIFFSCLFCPNRTGEKGVR